MATKDLGDPSPANNDNVCPACLNLEYGSFDVGDRLRDYAHYPSPRFRTITRRKITAAAQQFCPICTILDEGMAAFWGDENWDEIKDQRESSEDENATNKNEDDQHDNETDGENDHSSFSIFRGHSIYSGKDMPASSESSSEGEIFLELRPGRSLFIRRLDFNIEGDQTDRLGRLEFCTNQDDPRNDFNSAFGRGAVPLHRLSPDSAADILRRWLKLCDSHEECSPNPQSPPKRLIYISSNEQRLIETSSHPLSCLRYATLSHCWGNLVDEKPLQTTKDSYGARIQGIGWAELPTLFQDVIKLLRKLELRYLWVDSICIIQDDDSDWLEQSAKMASVYSHSYLNLAAAEAENSSQSLFIRRSQVFADIPHGQHPGPGTQLSSSTHPEPLYHSGVRCERWTTHIIQPAETSSAGVLVRPPNKLGHSCLAGVENLGRDVECPLLDRAWVYQEKLLAPRTAFFSRSELLWQCRGSMACECREWDNYWNMLPQIEAMLKQQSPAASMSGNESWEKIVFERILKYPGSAEVSQQARSFWLSAVTTYGFMALTRESDRAHAIAGVALKIQGATNDKYLAGLWLQDLPRALMWANFPFLEDYKDATRLGGGIPSWSWMSLKSGSHLSAIYDLHVNFQADPRVRIIEDGTWCRTEGHQFGPVQSGQIKLEAASLDVTISINKKRNIFFSFSVFGEYDRDKEDRGLIPDCPCDPAEALQEGDSALLILLGQSTMFGPLSICLAVKPAKDIQGAYRRVGIVFGDVDILPRGAPASTFILV